MISALLDRRWINSLITVGKGLSVTILVFLGLMCIQLQVQLSTLQDETETARYTASGEGWDPYKSSAPKVKPGDWGQIVKELNGDLSAKISELNTTARAKLDILFFNRVGKTGSEMVNGLIELLAQDDVNNFELYYPRKAETRMSWLTLKKEGKIVKRLATAKSPGAYIFHHVSFCNFTRHGYPMPIYMNMVRDPVERVISWFYYVRQPIHPVRKHRRWPDDFNWESGMPDPEFYQMDFETCVLTGNEECIWTQDDPEFRHDMRRQTLYFCAHGDEECKRFNSKYATQQAKLIVEKYYAVVGVQEAMDITLKVLEYYIPGYFANATAVYNDNKYTEGLAYQNRNNFKVDVSESVKAMIRPNFTNEIDFYQFCRQRLFRQYYAIKPLIDAEGR